MTSCAVGQFDEMFLVDRIFVATQAPAHVLVFFVPDGGD
jgi:hypothetical protein